MPQLPPPPQGKAVDKDGNYINATDQWSNLLRQQVNLTSSDFAPSAAQYVLTSVNSQLPGSQGLNLLAAGFVKVGNNTGVLSSSGSTLIQSSDLSSTGVTSGTYGTTTSIPRIKIGSDGRIITATNLTISGTSPGGNAGGDLSGTYPNPTVIKADVFAATFFGAV